MVHFLLAAAQTMTTRNQCSASRFCDDLQPLRAFYTRRLGKYKPDGSPHMPLPTRALAGPLGPLALGLLTLVVFAGSPLAAFAGFVGPSAITIDGVFTDWTGNVYSQADGSNTGAQAGSANDLTTVWYAMSTANGTAPASSSNPIQKVYFRFDTAETSASNPKQAYWVQLNLGTAAAGLADHALQFYVDTTATPKVTIALYEYATPYPAIAAFTTGTLVPRVVNVSGLGQQFNGVPVDTTATGSWALNGTTYSFEAQIPIGWYSSTYGGAISADGTGAGLIASAIFTSSGSLGSVGTVKDVLDTAAGNLYFSQVNATSGGTSFVAGNTGGLAYSATAADATSTPVAGAADTITLTVQKVVSSGGGATISTDTSFTGSHNVTISGFSPAPDGTYGSFNGVTLTGPSQTISVTFGSGSATPSLILNNAATQNIGFSLPDLTFPAANNLTITPTPAASSKLVFTSSPVTTTAGVASGTITVQRQDAHGNLNTADASRTVTLSSDSTGTKTFTPPTPLTINSGSGSVSFTYTDTKAGSPTITAASTSPTTITSGTQQETVNPAAMSQLVMNPTTISSAIAGTSVSGSFISIMAEDIYGNLCSTGPNAFTGTVTFGGTAGAMATSVAFTAGVLNTFPALIPTSAGGGKTVTATSGAIVGTTTITTVNPGPMTQLVMNPTTISLATAGTSVSGSFVSITAEDSYGNVCSSGPNAFTGTVTFGGTAGATGTSASFSAGVLNTFPTLTPTSAGSSRTVTATSGSVVGTTTITTVNPGPLDHFAIAGVPSTATAGTPMTGITITAQDVYNNTQTSFGGTVTYGGTAGVTGTSGTFTGGGLSGVSLTPTVAGSSLTVTATGDGKSGTATITTVNSGPADKLVFTTQPGNGAGGAAFSTQPVVTLQDQFGNTVTGTSQNVTLAIQNNPGSATLSGTTTVAVNTSTGVATFIGLSINMGGNGYTLTATGSTVSTAPGVVVSSPFNVMSAGPVSIGRAWGTSLRIPWSTVLAGVTGGTPPLTVQAATSPDGEFVQISGSYILFAPTANVSRTINYTVADSSTPAVISSSTITVNVTNAVSAASNISSTGNSVVITFAGIPGYNYVVERSSDMINGPWSPVTGSETTAPSSGIWTFIDSSPPNPSFYRLRQNN
jgi:hypothetical protein